ncbi:MAG TPA: HD-GYP domain-containing protein [Acidimicrobiia bacterium]|nr:HD-GYP domain-containing protein [Acidimicrobiia bacterium]
MTPAGGHGARRNGGLVALFAAPLVLLVTLRSVPSLDVAHRSVHFHLVVVSSIAACALTVAVLATVAAARLRQPGVVLLAIGCLVCGVAMLVHGLVTPGVANRPGNVWVARAPVVAVLAFALCQGAAVLAPHSRLARRVAARPVPVLGAFATALAVVATVVVQDPTALAGDALLPGEDDLARIAAVLSVVVLVPTAWTHWKRYRLGRDPIQLALTFAAAMTVAAVGSMRFGILWQLSWWDYHAYLLAGFAAAAGTIFVRQRSARTVDSVLDAAFATDPLEHISRNYPDALRALVRAVEVKDTYTYGHSRRTAEIATALGARLGLAPEELRLLAQGSYLHDVGKIIIPDEILNKPGRLTAEERAIIETHAAAGADLVAHTPALTGTVEIVRHHHERYDGTGYPAGVAAGDIPVLARIAAVADVWDALTSDRAYRPGWAPEQALAHIRAGSGSHFDPIVVQALVDLAADWGYRVAPGGDVDEAWEATQDCHEAGRSDVVVGPRR